MSSAPHQTHPHEAHIGQVVTWAGHDGETLTGVVHGYNAEIGKFIVKTDEGMKAVAPATVDQFGSD